MERQLHGLLISGEERRFVDETLDFQRYLISKVGLNSNNVRLILCTYMGNDYIVEESQLFFERLPRNGTICDVVLLYNGHGGKGTFFPNDSSLSYEEWARVINNNGDFIFLNNSCYAGSSIPAFLHLGLLPKKGLVIAASRRNELGYDAQFLDALIESYRNRQPFRRKIICRESFVEGLFTYNPNAKNSVVKRKSDGRVFEYLLNPWRFYPYSKPILDDIQHPVRRGKMLDHLLFPKR